VASRRPLLGVLLLGAGFIALLGGLVWSNVEGWDATAFCLIGSGVVALAAALGLNLHAVFLSKRGVAGLNAVVSGVLAMVGFGLLSFINYSMIRGAVDLTRTHKFTLSESTSTLLAGLEKKIDVTVILSPEDMQIEHIDLNGEIIDLVRQYEDNAPETLTIRIWDRVEHEIQILKFIQEIGLKPEELFFPVVVVRCGKAHKHLKQWDFVRFEEDSAALFRGEEVLTSAIMEVVEGKIRKVYFTRGHGEGEIALHDDRGFSQVQAAVIREHLDPQTLDIEKTRSIPEDCALLVVLAPRRRFTPEAVHAMSRYLEGGGRLLVFLDSALEVQDDPTRIAELLRRWGIDMLEGIVFDPEENFADNPAWVWVSEYGEHTLVQMLEGSSSIYLLPRGFRAVEKARSPGGLSLEITPLVQSSRGSWCETDRTPPKSRQDLKPGKDDLRGSLMIGAAVREGAV